MVKVTYAHLWKRCEKGKPVVRRGRNATGLLKEAAGLSNRELRKEMPGHLVK
jgi:hypothetical protein